jgi:hypothetical protein
MNPSDAAKLSSQLNQVISGINEISAYGGYKYIGGTSENAGEWKCFVPQEDTVIHAITFDGPDGAVASAAALTMLGLVADTTVIKIPSIVRPPRGYTITMIDLASGSGAAYS